jgi:hypothetical protein
MVTLNHVELVLHHHMQFPGSYSAGCTQYVRYSFLKVVDKKESMVVGVQDNRFHHHDHED